jgi:LacI family transcriptional regulator
MSNKRSRNTDQKKTKLGLREIASLAHVSITTVSRVLNGNNRVDPAIRKVVLDAAAQLNIDPSKRRKPKTLAFVLCNGSTSRDFHLRVLSGAEECSSLHGWDVVFLTYNYSLNASIKELTLPRVAQQRDIVRGLILSGTNSTNFIDLLNSKEIPFVLNGNNLIGQPHELQNDVIFSDDIQGGNDITRYLINAGHKNICFVGNTRLPWFARCFAGYCRAMEDAGLEPYQSSIDTENDTQIGYLGTKSLLASGRPMTAIFAGNDLAANGVYRALRESGLKIPDDASVVGCNDTVGELLYPSLTTIREFPEQLGKHMVELILNRISNPGAEIQQITIPTEFIKRDSCATISSVRRQTAEE